MRIQIQLLSFQSSFPYCPYAVGEKLVLSQVRERVRVQESLCGGTEGDGRQPKNKVKLEKNECKQLHALEFGQSSGFRGKRKELWPHGLCNKSPVMRMGKGGGCWE